MKIDSTAKIDGPSKIKESRGGKGRTTAGQTHQGGVQDEVKLTGNAAKLQELEARLAELEITDPQKVEAIRRAIAEGTFEVNDEAVADALIQEAIELISQQSQQNKQ